MKYKGNEYINAYITRVNKIMGFNKAVRITEDIRELCSSMETILYNLSSKSRISENLKKNLNERIKMAEKDLKKIEQEFKKVSFYLQIFKDHVNE